jgi:hypothetical protein
MGFQGLPTNHGKKEIPVIYASRELCRIVGVFQHASDDKADRRFSGERRKSMLLGGGVILADACGEFVKIAEACGAAGERVFDPKEIRGAFQRAVQSGRPYVIDIIMERETDCSMGVSLAAVREFE